MIDWDFGKRQKKLPPEAGSTPGRSGQLIETIRACAFTKSISLKDTKITIGPLKLKARQISPVGGHKRRWTADKCRHSSRTPGRVNIRKRAGKNSGKKSITIERGRGREGEW